MNNASLIIKIALWSAVYEQINIPNQLIHQRAAGAADFKLPLLEKLQIDDQDLAQ